MNEFLDRRILGALRLQDGLTGLALQRPLHLVSDRLVLKRNRQGDYVIFDVLDVAELHGHTIIFGDPPAVPTVESISIDLKIYDPLREYLPRRYQLRLPRDRDPQSSAAIVKPILISLYRSPSARTEPNWSVIRATLVDQTTGQRLPWALVNVVRNGPTTSAMSDERGEALIAVPGIPVTTWDAGGGAVLATEVDARLDVVFDSLLQQLKPTNTDLANDDNPNHDYIPDPDVLKSTAPSLRRGSRSGYRLAASRDRPDVIAVVLS
jgi:hypothetical protein